MTTRGRRMTPETMLTPVPADEPAGREVPDGVRAALGGHEPTAEQWAVIDAPLGPLRVVAGAGSGKTAVLAARVVRLLEAHRAPPSSVLCLTFTNKAVGELDERVRRATAAAPPGEGIAVQTYHAFAAELVASYGLYVGVEPGADLLSEAQQYQVLLRILDTEEFEHLEVRTPGSTIDKVLALSAACADQLVSPAAVCRHATELLAAAEAGAAAGRRLPSWALDEARDRVELCRLVDRYAREKQRRGRIDFGDQVAKAVELLERFESIAEAVRARYRHILLDEYQDTNVAQRRLLQRLCPAGSSVLVVGDARQAIYGFRGATMYNLLEFPRQFRTVDGAESPSHALSVSFRCGQRILDVANALIEAIPEERRGGGALIAAHGNGAGAVRAALLEDQYQEAGLVAEAVEAAHHSGLPGAPQLRWRDIAVLVRHKRLLGPLREALERRSIPVEVVGLSGLLEMPEIVDLVSALRAIRDPGDNIALARLLLGPRWRLGYRHLARLARWSAQHNHELKAGLPGEDPDPGQAGFALSDALDRLADVEGLDDQARDRLAAVHAELEALRARAGAPLVELVQAVLEVTGLRAELTASDDPRATTARQNIATFLDRVADFAPVEGEPSLGAFLAYLDAVQDAAEPVDAVQPAAVDSVKLMTAHAAKGLEFEMVAVAGLAAGTAKDGAPKEGIFPDVRVDNPLNARGFPYELREDAANLPAFAGNATAFREALRGRALEEERRLCYVAITRARRLVLLTAAWWYQGAERNAKGPGPFWLAAAAHPAVEVLQQAPQPESSPLLDRLRARRSWPPPARRPAELADELFPEGYAAAVARERAEPGTLAARVGAAEEGAFGAALAAQRHLLEVTEDPAPAPAALRRRLSVAEVLEYERCPTAFFWNVVRPLPRRPVPAARLGTMVHRMLERQARRLPDLGPGGAEAFVGPAAEADEPPPDRSRAEPGVIGRSLANFATSRFAQLPAPEPEVRVVLRVAGFVLDGRVDAIYRSAEGVELVDWKTGAPVRRQPAGLDQLGLYALALHDLGERAPAWRVTYCYLGGETVVEDSRLLGPADLALQRRLAEQALARIAAGSFGGACGLRSCSFCGGQRHKT